MPATLRIDLDNNTDGIESLISNLRAAAAAEGEMEAGAKLLSRTVDLSDESIAALTQSFAGLNKQTAESDSNMRRVSDSAMATASAIGKVGDGIEWVLGKSAPLIKFTLEHGRQVATAAAAYERYNIASAAAGGITRAAIGYLTGLGTAVTAAYVGYKGLTEILDRTGEKFVNLETGLEETSAEFRNFVQGAKNAGVAIDQFVDRSGQSLSDFNVKVETNLTRTTGAIKKMVGDVARPFTEFGMMVEQDLVEPISRFAHRTWKDFDASVTRGSNQIVSDVEKMRGAWKSYRVAADAIFTDGDFERARRQIDLLDEAAESTRKLAEANRLNRPDFEALRAYNEERERSIENEEYYQKLRGKAPVGGFKPTDYGKEQAEIDRLRQEAMDEAGRAAQAGNYDAEYEQEHAKVMAIIDDREKALRARREADHEEGIKRIWKQQEEQKKALDQQIHDQVEASRKAWEESEKAAKDARDRQTEEERKAIEERLAIYRYSVKEREKAEAEAARAQQQRMAELARSFQGGPTAADARGQSIDIERKTAQQIFELRKQATQQYLTGDVKGFFESQQKQYEILQQSLEAQRQLRAKFSKEANPLEQLKSQIGDQDIAKQIEKDRLDKLRADRAKNRPDPFANDDVVDPREERQRARYDRETRRMEQDARRRFRRDLQRGDVGEEEVNKATNELTRATIDAAQKNGDLGRETADALRAGVEAQQKQAQLAADHKQQIEGLKEAYQQVSEQLEEIGVSGRARAMRR